MEMCPNCGNIINVDLRRHRVACSACKWESSAENHKIIMGLLHHDISLRKLATDLYVVDRKQSKGFV